QHRLLPAPHPDGRAGGEPAAGRLHLPARPRTSLLHSPRPGARAAPAHASSLPAHTPEPRAARAPRLPVRGLHARGLRAASRDQGADRRLTRVVLLVLIASAAHAELPEPPVAPRIAYTVKSPQGDRVDEYYWLRDD